jgi:hypothetical protein
MEICPKYDNENRSEKFSAEMVFFEIDPWTWRWWSGTSASRGTTRAAPGTAWRTRPRRGRSRRPGSPPECRLQPGTQGPMKNANFLPIFWRKNFLNHGLRVAIGLCTYIPTYYLHCIQRLYPTKFIKKYWDFLTKLTIQNLVLIEVKFGRFSWKNCQNIWALVNAKISPKTKKSTNLVTLSQRSNVTQSLIDFFDDFFIKINL